MKKYFPTFGESPGRTEKLITRTEVRREYIRTFSQLELSGGKRKPSTYKQNCLPADFSECLTFFGGTDRQINSTKTKYNLGCSDSVGPSDRTADISDHQTGRGLGGV